MNNYELGKLEILNSDYNIKALKTFQGMDTVGINANLYDGKKKVGFIIDSGNGGSIYVDFIHEFRGADYQKFDKFIKSLPKYKNIERGFDFKQNEINNFNSEAVLNTLVDRELKMRDFKRSMKKVQIFDPIEKTISYYKGSKPSELGQKIRHKGKPMVWRNALKSEGYLILNDMTMGDAFVIFDKYV